MVARSFQNSPALAISHDAELFSMADVKTIITTVGVEASTEQRWRLYNALNAAGEKWCIQNNLQRQPTPKMVTEKFQSIKYASENLLQILGVGPRGSLKPMSPAMRDRLHLMACRDEDRTGKSGHEFLSTAIAAIARLNRWSAQIAEQAEDLQGAKGNTGNTALKDWVIDLADIYSEAGLGKPGVSLSDHTGAYSGPFYRFVLAASEKIMSRDKSNSAWGQYIRECLKSRKGQIKPADT